MRRGARPAIAAIFLGCLAVAFTGCADQDSLAYRVQNYDGGQNPGNQSVAEAGPQDPVLEDTHPQDASDVSGPVQLRQPEENDTAQRPHPKEPENRFAFLDWFGNSANRAKVKDPVTELRKARAITAAMGHQPNSQQSPEKRQAFMIGEDSRLVPTYIDGLPDPGGEQPAPDGQLPQLRGADITGSVTPPTEPATLSTTVSADDPAGGELLRIDERLRQADEKLTSGGEVYASVDPGSIRAARPQHLPDRDNPVRLHVGLNGPAFDKDDLAVLKSIAAMHRKSGRNVHIHGVSRGPAGDSDTSIKRVKRLHKHTERAIAALARFGVQRGAISTSTAEQRMTGVYFGTERPTDRDRLELSFQ